MPSRKLLTAALILTAGVAAAFAPHLVREELEIGAKAPLTDVTLTDISGEELTLAEVAQENGLLVIFSSNTCPWVQAWEDRYVSTAEQAKQLNIGMVVLNPNEARRGSDESIAAMRKRAEQIGYNFPYAVDKDHRLADAFGAEHTPHVYLFNEDMELLYRGAIDDNARNPDQVGHHYLADAMNAMVAGEEIPKATSKSIGCTIKRLES